MFKKLSTTVLALLLYGIVWAQEQPDRWVWPDTHIRDALFFKADIGPKIGAGVSIPSYSSDDIHPKGGLAYQLGVAANIRVEHDSSLDLFGIGRWGMEVEALFSSRSFGFPNGTLSMKCFEVPILAQFCATSSIILEAGLTPIMFLGATPEYLQLEDEVAILSGMKGNDVMLSAGACYKTSFGLVVGLRYNHGTSDWAENFQGKTRMVMFSASYLFPIVK